ncbi:MAG: FtsX-like permease family protein [Myxococcota bacterium]
MAEPRWTRLIRDVAAERGRFGGMVAAIAVSLAAVGTVLGAYAILTREMARNYLATSPADATIELGVRVDDAVLASVRATPGVDVAEAGGVIRARFADGDRWRPILLFVVDDPEHQQLATQRTVAGARAEGALAVERTAASLFGLAVGAPLRLRLADGSTATIPIGAIVHDPGLAPAWQERTAYGFLSRATLSAAIGRDLPSTDLRVRFTDRADTADVDAAARALAGRLVDDGVPVHQIRVPPFERHPHQRQMTTLVGLLLVFAALSLVLSAIVVATSLAALLARQVREIGVLKTIGGTTGQIAATYAVLVGGLGVAAVGIAVPLGAVGAAGLSRVVAAMLNFELARGWPPGWVYAVQLMAGIAVPLALASIPIARAARITVREALDQHGVAPRTLGPAFARWPRAVRAVIRRPGRLASTLGLLGAAGAMFVTAQSVSDSWTANLAKIAATRFDDVEVRFAAPVADAAVRAITAETGVSRVEGWSYDPAAFTDGRSVEIARTWPDRGHGSLARIALPPDTALVRFPLTAGRWLVPGDTDAAVINQGALAQRPGLAVGDPIGLSIEGVVHRYTIVGVVEEIGSPGAVYVARGPTDPVTAVRIAARDPAAVERAIDAGFDGAPVDAVIPRAELEQAVGGHVEILIRALTAMALVMATVGGLGLASTTAIAVVERTREIGVWKTLGATPARITGGILAESAATGVASAAIAFAGSVPLTFAIDAVVGRIGFLAPLPFAWSWTAAAAWVGLVAALSVVATVAPATRAGAMTVREALATP